MKYLLTLTLALFIITGCSDNGSSVDPKPEFEPKVIGTFMQTSPNDAEYIGFNYTPNKTAYKTASGIDSVVVENPDDYGFVMEDDSVGQSGTIEAVKYTFYDSTNVSRDSFTDIRVDWNTPEYTHRPHIKASRFTFNSQGNAMVSGHMHSLCQYPQDFDIKVSYFQADTVAHITVMKFDKLVETFKSISECAEL